jgi:predicted O-methyltransferase YrrM
VTEIDRERRSSLDDPRVRAVLDRLHAEEHAQRGQLVRMGLSTLADRLRGKQDTVQDESDRIKDCFVALSPKQGTLAYMVARSIGARRVVEFGTSFGISTIYLAAAVRDNGGGLVIGSEMQPTKLERARAHLAEAGLGGVSEVRAGDARETLKDPGSPIDMVLLDGAKQLYLEMLRILTPHLRTGSVVLADNILIFRKALRPYVEHVQDPRNGFRSVTLFLGSGTEYSMRL